VALIKPSRVNRNINVYNFIVPFSQEILEELENISYMCKREGFAEIGNVLRLSDLLNDHSTKLNEFMQQHRSKVVYLNEPMSVRDINWKEVVKSNMLENETCTSNFVYNMDTLNGWSNPVVQKYMSSIYSQRRVPSWVCDARISEIPSSLSNIIKSYRREPYTDLYSLFVSGPKFLYGFNTYDGSLTKYVELTEIDKVAKCINSCLDNIKDTCSKIGHRAMVEDRLENAGSIAKLVKNMDYKMIIAFCYRDKEQRIWIQSMIGAILSDPKIKESVKNGDGLSQDSRNKIWESIVHNPFVYECGYSEGYFYMIYRHARDYICSTPEEFVNSRLRDM
jgi:hypothetical protein